MQKILKISQQTFFQSAVKVITTVAGFLALGVISRTYGESGIGHFTLALTYLAFFYIFADFSFNAHFLHKFKAGSAKSEAEWKKLLGTRILWSLALTLLALLILPFLPSGFSSYFKLAVLFGSPIIVFYAVAITSHVLFQANLKYQYDVLSVFLSILVGVGLIFGLAYLRLPVYFVLLAYPAAWFIHSFGDLFFVKKFVGNLTPIFHTPYALNLFKNTWPLAGTLVLNVVYFRADAFILAYYKTPADVGIYNLAYQVFQSILVLPTFIMNSFYPMMLETLKINIDRFSHQIKIAFLGLLFLSFSILLTTYYLSPLIIKIITGSGFIGSTESLKILSLGFPAYFLSALLMWIMVAKNMYKKLLLVYGLGLAVNIAANLIFIPQHGYIAASWITGASEYFILILQAGILLKR